MQLLGLVYPSGVKWELMLGGRQSSHWQEACGCGRFGAVLQGKATAVFLRVITATLGENTVNICLLLQHLWPFVFYVAGMSFLSTPSSGLDWYAVTWTLWTPDMCVL